MLPQNCQKMLKWCEANVESMTCQSSGYLSNPCLKPSVIQPLKLMLHNRKEHSTHTSSSWSSMSEHSKWQRNRGSRPCLQGLNLCMLLINLFEWISSPGPTQEKEDERIHLTPQTESSDNALLMKHSPHGQIGCWKKAGEGLSDRW